MEVDTLVFGEHGDFDNCNMLIFFFREAGSVRDSGQGDEPVRRTHTNSATGVPVDESLGVERSSKSVSTRDLGTPPPRSIRIPRT